MKGSDRNLLNITTSLEERRSDFRSLSIAKLIASSLKPGSLLDVGCGSGHFMYNMRRLGFNVHGLEPNAEIIKEGRRIFGNMDIRKGPAEDMTKLFGRMKFDNIMMIDVLEHIEDDELVLELCNEILKPGGRIIILVPAYPSLFSDRDEMYGHYRRYSKSDLQRKMEAAGFNVMLLKYWNALLLPLYVLYIKLRIDMEEKYICMRNDDGLVSKALAWWFNNVENRIALGFGVNLFSIGEKIS